MENEIIFKIYKHTSPSGKVYIGQTCQKNVIQRWRNGGKGYFSKNPKTGEYHQPLMVNAIKKYDWDLWQHEIIAECNNQDEANCIETYYIKLYKSNDSNFGYNLTEGGTGHHSQPMKQSTKDKLSKAVKELWKDPEYRAKQISRLVGKPMHENTRKALYKANLGRAQTEEAKQKLREYHPNYILQFSLDGDFIKEYFNASDIIKEMNLKSVTSITNNCKGISKRCGNYIYLYKSDYESNPNLLQDRLKILHSRKKSAKPIIQLDKNNNIIKEYPSITDAAEETKISLKGISNCLRGSAKTSGGYIWKYK